MRKIDQLEEASALKDIAHMPARVKCAVLGWHTLDEAFKKDKRKFSFIRTESAGYGRIEKKQGGNR